MSKKVMSVLEEMTGGKSYRAHKYGLDNNERPSIDYTEDNIIWQETAETKRNRNYVPLWDESKKVLTSGTNILSFFLDGSRRVFKVDDMGFVLPGGRNVIFPVIAGQIGIGCTRRENRVLKQEKFYQEFVLSISHITDAQSFLTNFISSDFGDVTLDEPTLRIGMNYVEASVSYNSKGIYTPVHNNAQVYLANADEINAALGLKNVKNPLVCGSLKMYEGTDEEVTLPVHLNSQFILGPEGAHLNISGISGLASKTSYAMFLMKGLLVKGKELIDIQLDARERTITITDNATGIPSAKFKEVLTNIADSDKQIGEAKGFRGIGRLCGLAYCRELVFSSKAPGETQINTLRCYAWDMGSARC